MIREPAVGIGDQAKLRNITQIWRKGGNEMWNGESLL